IIIVDEIEKVSNADKILVYPNPTSDYIHIKGITCGTTISIYSSDGRFIQSEIVKSDETIINIASFKAGIYYIKAGKEGKVVIKH
ncbi:T9SS type A sorting domain-containing protein, partial [Bacteroidales bacterium OttesenSCG-928-M11]|nr:T9SS type A sorting domain-containing protein [Bacteroidales bacterium OttesenSCG-928-M11]